MLEEYLERLRAVYGLGLFSLLAAGAAETVGRAAAGGQQAESGFVSGGRRSADGYEQDAAREVREKFGGWVGEDLIKRGGWSELPAAAAEDAAAGWFTAAGGDAGRWRTAEEQLSAAGGRFFGAAGSFDNLHIDYNQYNELNAAEAGSAVRGAFCRRRPGGRFWRKARAAMQTADTDPRERRKAAFRQAGGGSSRRTARSSAGASRRSLRRFLRGLSGDWRWSGQSRRREGIGEERDGLSVCGVKAGELVGGTPSQSAA